MPTLTEAIRNPGDVTPPATAVTLELWGTTATIHGYKPSSAISVAGATSTVDSDGAWSIANVVGNADITIPTGTVYRVVRHIAGRPDPLTDYISMPTTGGPYRVDELLTDPPGALTPSGLAAHAADTALHGGGQRIFVANVTSNFTTASTSFVDLPGASGTFTVPSRPFVVKGQIPITVETAGQGGEVRIMSGSTMIAWTFIPATAAAGQTYTCQFEAQSPLPIWNPTAGSSVTVRVTMKSTLSTSDLTVFVDFAGPINTCQLWAHTV